MGFMENLANGKYDVSRNDYKSQDDVESNASQDVDDIVEVVEDILKDFEVRFYNDYVKPLEKKVEKLSKRESENKFSGSDTNSDASSNSSTDTKVDIYSGIPIGNWVYFINADEQLWKAKSDGSNAQCLVAKAIWEIEYIEDGYVYYILKSDYLSLKRHKIKV